mgnify:CR=1 FL=1
MAASRRSTPSPASPLPRRLLDARPDRLDLRDLPYRPPLRSLPPQWPADEDIARYMGAYARAGLVLDQGSEGACTGFGLACVANFLLWRRAMEAGRPRGFEPVSPRMFYELARRYDEWPGDDYEGSSCRGALKGWHKHGACAERLWPHRPARGGARPPAGPGADWARDAATRPLGVYYRVDRNAVVDLQAAIREVGAVYASAEVHGGWDRLLARRPARPPRRAADLPLIPPRPAGGEAGGHAFALVGYDARGFIVQNSWGPAWGRGGFAVLPYEDWVRHATDAWACALGVPVAASQARLAASAFPVASGRSLASLSRAARAAGNPQDDPWPVDRAYAHRGYEPWGTAKAYAHTLVSGNEGRLAVSDVAFGARAGTGEDARAAYARRIVLDNALGALVAQPGKVARLAVYAHGGLNGEAGSVERIRVLGPCFAANGVHPLFLTWRTGPLETLGSMARDALGLDGDVAAARAGGFLDGVREAADRMIEAKARLLLRGVWSEMRENAERAARPGHVLDLLAVQLLDLRDALAARGKELEIHLAGHSAGSILLGHLLARWCRDDLRARAPEVRSATLHAAACSVEFALRTWAAAAEAGILDLSRLSMAYLSDANERRDALPAPGAAIYGKSLLYLVSRALDDARKIPLLGMERANLPAFAGDGDQWAAEHLAHVARWQALWQPGPGSCIEAPQVVVDAAGTRRQAVHGCFDNDIATMTRMIEAIAGRALVAPLEWLDY